MLALRGSYLSCQQLSLCAAFWTPFSVAAPIELGHLCLDTYGPFLKLELHYYFPVVGRRPYRTWTPMLGHLCLDTYAWTPMDPYGPLWTPMDPPVAAWTPYGQQSLHNKACTAQQCLHNKACTTNNAQNKTVWGPRAGII